MEIIWSVFSCPKEEKERKEIEETRDKNAPIFADTPPSFLQLLGSDYLTELPVH